MRIKDKIKKLLALATSPNENEARDALLKAKELMAKHKMSEDDFKDEEEQELVHLKCTAAQWTTDSGSMWMASLCQMICENHLCVSAWNTPMRTRTHTLIITGMKEDAELCKEIVEYAVGFIKGRVKELQRKAPASEAKSIESSYATGFIMGMEMAYAEQKEEHPEWGLVVVKPDEVKGYEENLSTREIKIKQQSFDPLAHIAGQMDGKNFNNKKAITA